MKLIFVTKVIFLVFLALPASADILLKNVVMVDYGEKPNAAVDILVVGNAISKVGKEITLTDEMIGSINVIDGAGKLVSPGLFNATTQLGLVEVDAIDETVDFTSSNSRVTASLRVSDAINPSSVLIPHNRMLGLTHALVVPNSEGGLFAGIASIIRLTDTDAVLKSEAAMVVTLGAQGKMLAGGSRAAAIALLREAFEDARDYRANKATFDTGNRREYQLSRRDLDALEPVLDGRLPLLVYVDRAIDIERVVKLAKQFDLKLIIAGAIEGWRVAQLLADNNVPVIIDPIMNLPTSYDTLGARLDNAKRLDEAGVTLLLTGMSWHNTHNAYLVRQSAGNAVANGLAYSAAIEALTINPAKVFDLDGIGKIAEGAKANLVLWSADPLEPSARAELVIIDGVDYPLQSRATRLRDRYYLKLKNAE